MPRNRSFVTIFTASIGGLLEMYDFTIYAFLAPTISKLFFVEAGPKLSMILTFAVFAIGYLVRPIGGILFGHVGDRSGRKTGLLATISLMGGATFLMGCLPTYHQIGLAAPILLLLLRISQGIAVGGDLPGGMTYLSEEADSCHGGRYLGYLFASINLGALMAASLSFSLQDYLPTADFAAWGWRIPFWASLILSVVGLLQRHKLEESVSFQRLKQQKQVQRVPFLSLFQKHAVTVGKAVLMLSPFTVIFCTVFLFGPTYLHQFLKLPYEDSMRINTIGLACFTVSFPIWGWVSDKIGKDKMLCLTFFFLFAAPYAYYSLLGAGYALIATVIFSSIWSACAVGLLHPFTQLFDTSIRYTGIAFSYNILFALGGSIPALLTSYIPSMPSLPVLPLSLFLLSTLLLVGSFFVHRKG